jgi:hypothetical protein
MKTINYLFLASILLFVSGCNNGDEIIEPGNISGSLTNHSDCKNIKSEDLKTAYPDSVSCVLFSYNEDNHTLQFHHINAGFNCCPEGLYCEISSSNDTIFIQEFEKEQACNCDCLFDLDIELQGVASKIYQVRFIEPYIQGQEELFFEMDLSSGNEGEYCVTRKVYPWGTTASLVISH